MRLARTTLAALVLGIGAPALADVPEGMIYDDGFTWYGLDNHDDTVDGRRVDVGWELVAEHRMYGRASARSQFKMVIKKGDQTLGETRCEVTLANHHERTTNGAPYFFTSSCRDRSQRIRETGDITVEVYFVDDDTDAEHLLRTHVIHVLTATRVRGTGDPDSPHHYVSRNGEVLSTILYLQPMEIDGYLEPGANGRCGNCNRVHLLFNAHPDRDHWSISSSTHMRCSVDGTRIPIEDDQVTGRQTRMNYVVHSTGRGRRQTEGEVVDVGFRQFRLELPITFERQASTEPVHGNQRDPLQVNERHAVLGRHPGQWECQWRDGSTVLRTFRWTVQPNGRIAPHAEQGAGLTLGPNTFLVDTVLPQPASVYDTRLSREAVVQRAFNGRGWRTEAGRALANAVQDHGDAAPPQPQPPEPERPARRRRGR